MNMATFIGIAAVVLILALAVRYIVKHKREGAKCIGCPVSETCSKCQCDLPDQSHS